MKTNQDGLQVLPWHREAAKELNEAFNLYCWDEAKDDAAAIIARHDEGRTDSPALRLEKNQHATTLRLLEEALIGIDLAAKYETTAFLGFVLIGDKIRAHLAAHSKPAAMQQSAKQEGSK